MKCLILAAGYATRLYPLTENFPKPLLKVGGKAILEWLMEDLDTTGAIDEYIVISNHKFAHHFESWAATQPRRITVVDDGTDSNETRLGAVRDIQFAIDTLALEDDLLVMAGDNLLDFSLSKFIAYGVEKAAPCTLRYYEPSHQKLLKSGVVSVDGTDRITLMTEKSPEPASHWVSIAFYYYPRQTVSLVERALREGCNPDAPGSLMRWLSGNSVCYAMEMPGKRYDIGDIASYEQVQREYTGIVK